MNTILDAVRSVLPRGKEAVALHEPFFGGNEKRYVEECLTTGWVSSVGKFVDRFETALSSYTGIKYAFAMVNGTAALHMTLKIAGVEPSDEVFVPDLTFVATANAATYCGAVPHFVDSEEKTLGVDPVKLERWLCSSAKKREDGFFYNKETGRRLRAVVAVHVFGHPADLDRLKKVCDDFNLALVEDAAEALGSLYKGKHVGHSGRFVVLSFNGNKICTTGGGGAILTNDESAGAFTRHVATTAKVPHLWEFYHDQVGYNYRMPSINAALGLAQLEQLPSFLKKKRALAERYQRAFQNVAGVHFFSEPEFAKSNYWLNAILLDKEFKENRDPLIKLLNQNGVKARPTWTLMHKLPMFHECPRMDVSVAEDIEARLVNLPSSAFLVG